ncbi:endoribonuclease [Prunus dulcis]|uniref:Diphthine--ammonia ligase n=1 Tax=Prunus dulcis TaxID=3755 RepID=A0A4Y1RR39_PRUDU|nr:endoribonuclease [Prunus dulcis]
MKIVAVANLMPADDSVDELDSYMYQTVGHQIVVSYAECMGVPLHQKLSYRMTLGDEVEDMFFLLNEVKRQIPSVTGVSSGAIASDYQRLRVESVCSRLGLVSLAYLWKQDQSLLLQEMITNGIVAITVKVAAMGLDPSKHLGKEMASLQPYLHKLKEFHSSSWGASSPGFSFGNKAQSCSLGSSDKTHEMYHEKKGFVCEVQGDHPQGCDAACQDDALVNNLVELAEHKLHISRTQKGDTFSICSRLQDSCTTSPGLQEDLEAILKKIESLLVENGFGWENVLYIHLYIADMNEFATANDTYVRYITQEKCPFGVPSRSTIELPLLQVGLGSAYMEVFVANDHTKRVLHVQRDTSHGWTVGLNPPTMTLCQGGAIDELEKALENSEAVAKCFNCSVSTSAIAFVIYCSTKIPSTERFKIQDKQDAFLKQTRVFNLDKGTNSEAFDPIFLYVLVPDLPKGALVEVKPILFVADDIEEPTGDVKEQSCSSTPGYWGFQHAEWHDSCFQKCVVPGKLCTVILSVNSEPAATICHDHLVGNKNKGDNQNSLTEWQMDRVLRFCIYLLDKIITESGFSWDDTMYLRFYFPISLQVPANALSLMFTNAFDELAAMGRIIKTGKEPIFNLVPVLGAGRSSASMDDIITCELLARKS